MPSNNITPELASALVKAIAETKDVKADATNPFHKNSYATLGAHLEATKGIFSKHGLAIVQFPFGDAHNVGINTMVIHKDGGHVEHYVTLPVSDGFKGQDAGSLFSYLRRYAIASVAGLATTDDDAEGDRAVRSAPQPATYSTGVFAKPAPAVAVSNGVVHADEDLNLVIHFGKNKGKTLGELPANSLDWYIKEFQPKPYNGKISPQDVALREALDRLASKRGGSSEPEDNAPF